MHSAERHTRKEDVMDKPVFVETSEGYINLALVRTIRVTDGVDGNRWASFTFSGMREVTPDHVAIPEKEWLSLQSRMAYLMLEN
jgi:hypothetical protein